MRMHCSPRRVVRAVLLGAHAAQRHRVHKLEMARVETKRQMHLFARRRRPIVAVTQMIFHVTVTDGQLRIIGKLAENLARAFANDIGQHVQAAAMSHAENDFLDALCRRPFRSPGPAAESNFHSLRAKNFLRR